MSNYSTQPQGQTQPPIQQKAQAPVQVLAHQLLLQNLEQYQGFAADHTAGIWIGF